MADSGKRFVGLSDFTAFNLALLAKTGAVSYTGRPPSPISAARGRRPDRGAVRRDHAWRAGDPQLRDPGRRSGRLPRHPVGQPGDGGIAAGHAVHAQVRGILFLEDVAEHPYRVERMLIQLWQAGILDKQKAIVLGRFSDYKLAPHDNGYDLHEVVAWLQDGQVPVVTGLPTATSPPRPRCRSDRRSAWPPSRAWRTWSSTSIWGKPTRVVGAVLSRSPPGAPVVCRPGLLHYRVFPGASSAAPFGQLSYPRSKTP